MVWNIYINGSIADKCTEEEENESGICIYNGYGRALLNESNATGNIYIDGASIVSKEFIAVNNYTGNIYICNAELDGKTADIRNDGAGNIYYTKKTIFKNDIKTDNINDPSHIILDDNISCAS